MRSLSLRSLLLALLALPLAVHAVLPSSDPVGLFNLRLRGNSDTLVSLPLHRPPLVDAAIQVRTGNQLELSDNVPALPAEGAYILVMSGALEGAILPATSLSGRTLTINTGAYDLATLQTEAANGVSQGDLVSVIPYWTLDTVFPAGTGINISTSASTRNTEVLLYDHTVAGINLSPSATFFYFVGNSTKPAGWYKVGDTSSLKGNQPLAPASHFVVRHKIATSTSLALAGCVQMAGYRIPLAQRSTTVDQDNLVGLPIATAVTLGTSGLITSGAFAASASASERNDELMVFDNTVVGQNKSASAVYFYFSGNEHKPAGWYQVGATASAVDSVALKPAEGYVIRKRKTAVAHTDLWNGLPAYLQ